MKINTALLEQFEKTINTLHPEQGSIPIKVLGFGEISIVFELVGDPENLAYKRLPIFSTEDQVKRHVNAYHEYNRILTQDIGISIPPQDAVWFIKNLKKHKITLYSVQQKLNPNSIGNKLIKTLPPAKVLILMQLILRELKKIWAFNRIQTTKGTQIGIDGQISNWALVGYDESKKDIEITDQSKLLYINTSTPLYRINGVEAMEPVLFLKSAPSFLVWLLKWLFLQEVVDRYYSLRDVIMDLVANFYKEQLPELIPQLIQLVNTFLSTEAKDFEIAPLSEQEVAKYYENDKTIWVVFQKFRRWDRFLKTKIFRKEYDFYLPEPIKR